MERAKRPVKKVNNHITKKRAINREEIIKKRIEMLLFVGFIGLIVGIVIGILIPIGGIKKTEYKQLENRNNQLKVSLDKANKDLDLLEQQLEEGKVFISLEKEQKQQVINYINALNNEEISSDKTITTTDLYNKIYKEYAYSLGYLNIDDFNVVIDSFGYSYDIVEENSSKQITLKNEYEDDNVILTFDKSTDNEALVLKSIRYNKDNKYIEVNNSLNNEIQYIIYDGSVSNVKNIKEQAEFLFSE
ncbi:Uncharacterised protein [uncultured Clostridium sp.]|nr:Uncharacterised protein [uncultured Clostridium sp.]